MQPATILHPVTTYLINYTYCLLTQTRKFYTAFQEAGNLAKRGYGLSCREEKKKKEFIDSLFHNQFLDFF